MSAPGTSTHPHTDIAVELSTQELRALTPHAHGMAAAQLSSTPAAPSVRPRRPASSRGSGAWVVAIAFVPVAALTLAGAYMLKPGPDMTPTPVVTSGLIDPSLMREWQRIPEEQREPVRFSNPFDPAEVFEFPPGTTRAEARAAVADILKARALERDPSLAP